tara:strand:- start:559 stop:873 length:315 start_codon:yes stop_codon:yes gene_type:complete
MTSFAQEAMEMGLDPAAGPDGREWEESIYKRPSINKEIFGESDDGPDSGKFDMDTRSVVGEPRNGSRSYSPPNEFRNFQEAASHAKSNPGKIITRGPNGGFIIK